MPVHLPGAVAVGLGEEREQLAVHLGGVGHAVDVRVRRRSRRSGRRGAPRAGAGPGRRPTGSGRPSRAVSGSARRSGLMSAVKSSSQPSGHAHVASGPASAPAAHIARTVSSLTRLPRYSSRFRKSFDHPGQPRVPVVEDRLLDPGDPGLVDAVRVVGRLDERRGEALDEHRAAQPVGAVPADVAGHLAGAEGEPDHGHVAEVELGAAACRGPRPACRSRSPSAGLLDRPNPRRS